MDDSSTQKVTIEKKYCPQCFQQFEGFIELCPQDQTVLRGPKNDPWIGKVFAERYMVESILGLGGMSVVYKAKHKLMDRTVAIKMLHNVLKQDVVALERFKLEAQACSSLSHHNVITVYDFGVTPDGEPFFVMDCLEGESLKDLIERKGRIPFDRALSLFKQICDGLEAAHKRGIIHRDLKPANVIVTKQDDGSELVRLVDFGIAKMMAQPGKEQQQLTRTGEVFGSPIYMSPEQCLGKELDARSDIYALGCLMYETLAGEPPFVGGGFLETMNMHVGEIAKPINEFVPDAKIPSELEEIIARCMAKEPGKRFSSVSELRDTLVYITTALLGSSRTHISSISGARPAAKSPAPVHAVASNVVALICAVLLIGIVCFCAMWPGPPDDRGTPFNKILWQLTLAAGDSALTDKDFAVAEQKLNQAEVMARQFGDHKTRLNLVLDRKSDLYELWDGHAEALAKTNSEIREIENERVTNDAKNLLTLIEKLKNTPLVATDGGAQLKAEAQVPMLISTAKNLHGKGLYENEELLLSKAIEVARMRLGNDSVQTAEIATQLADCLQAQRKYERVRPLLADAMAVYKNKSDRRPEAYARALAKLGQFDTDRTDLARSGPELSQALEIARKAKASHEVLVLCLRSYADYLGQTGKKAEAQALIKEADGLDK